MLGCRTTTYLSCYRIGVIFFPEVADMNLFLPIGPFFGRQVEAHLELALDVNYIHPFQISSESTEYSISAKKTEIRSKINVRQKIKLKILF